MKRHDNSKRSAGDAAAEVDALIDDFDEDVR